MNYLFLHVLVFFIITSYFWYRHFLFALTRTTAKQGSPDLNYQLFAVRFSYWICDIAATSLALGTRAEAFYARVSFRWGFLPPFNWRNTSCASCTSSWWMCHLLYRLTARFAEIDHFRRPQGHTPRTRGGLKSTGLNTKWLCPAQRRSGEVYWNGCCGFALKRRGFRCMRAEEKSVERAASAKRLGAMSYGRGICTAMPSAWRIIALIGVTDYVLNQDQVSQKNLQVAAGL